MRKNTMTYSLDGSRIISWKILLLSLFNALILLSCGSDSDSKPVADFIIVPGERVSDLVIGASEASVLGKDPVAKRDKYANDEVYLEFKSGKLNAVFVSSEKFVTENGIRVGSTKKQLNVNPKQKTITNDKGFEIELASHKENGIEYFFDDNDVIKGIRISR